MTTDFSRTQLAAILSALDGQPRHPANKAKALAAIERHAHGLGLTTQEVLEAAPGLLDGTTAPEAWRHQRHQQARAKAESVAAEVIAGIKAEREAAEAPAEVEEQVPPDEPTDAPAPEAAPAAETEAAPRRQREGSKQATLIAMLRRPEGADLDEIAEALKWRKHTIRGVISGALKKKLGLEVTAEKDAQGRRIYKIDDRTTEARS